MSLPQLYVIPPSAGGLEEYMFAHDAHHKAIITALAAKGIALQYRPIYPFSEDNAETWLEVHQSLHDDFNGALHLIGNDLTTVDLTDQAQRDAFVNLNFREHQAAAAASGQPI